MKILRLLIVCALPVMLIGAPRAMRVVSTTLVTDEILSQLVEPERVVGLSQYASDGVTSNAAELARRVNVFVDRNAEQIIALKPDLVISARYSRIELKALIQQVGIPLLELTQFQAISDVESNVRAVAKAVGEEARGEALIRDMRRKLDAARQQTHVERRAWKVLYITSDEWTAGRNTMISEVLANANVKNAAIEAGITGNVKISLEKVIQLDPDVIMLSTGYPRDADFERLLQRDPRFASLRAIRNKRVVALPSRFVKTASQFIGDAALELSRRINALP